MNLGRGAKPKGYIVEDIWQELARAKYLLWEQESSKRSWELQSLKYVLLVSFSLPFWKVAIIIGKFLHFSFSYECFMQFLCCFREACEAALEEKHVLDISRKEGFLDEASSTHLKQMEALRQVFRKAAEDDTPAEVSISIC